MKHTTSLNYAQVIAAVIGLCAGSAAACQQGGGGTSIFSLPTLGGAGVQVNAINSCGQITGFSDTASGVTHAFFYGANGLTDIGTFGGDLSQGLAINKQGVVVGDADLNPSSFHAFSYDQTNLLDLGTLGGSFSSATAINDAGQIVGNSTTANDGPNQAFLFQGGSITNIGDLGGGQSSAVAINQNGAIAGNSVNLDFESHAFLWTNGTMIDLGTLGGTDSRAFFLNDSNTVVGESTTGAGETHAFISSGGSMTDLGTLGGTFASPRGINKFGLVAGNSSTANDAQFHGFIYNGSLSDIGTLGGTYSEVSAINNLGQVVGQASIAGDATTHAFIWQNGTMTDLNDALPANSGWELISADFINDATRIVGFGRHNGNFEVFVLDLGGVSNNPPVANAGTNQTVDCSNQVTLDGTASSDPDGDVLTYQWSEGNSILGAGATLTISLPLGLHTISLQVTDPCGAVSQSTVQVTVVDTSAPVVTCPAPVTVNVDLNCQAAVPNVTSQVQAIDNCSSQGSFSISQVPAAGTLVGLGQHSIAVTVTDPSGNAAGCSVVLNVVDTLAPTIVSGPAIPQLSAGAQCQAAVPSVIADIIATDNCTPANQLTISQNPVAGTLVGLGQHAIVVTVTDLSGNSTSGSISFTVADTTAPVIQSITASPSVISPANGRVVPVTVSVSATDNCDASPVSQIISVTSNETVAPGDIAITGDLTVSLVADRNPGGSGRIYTITVRTTDASGNSTTGTVLVTVPKGNSKKP